MHDHAWAFFLRRPENKPDRTRLPGRLRQSKNLRASYRYRSYSHSTEDGCCVAPGFTTEKNHPLLFPLTKRSTKAPDTRNTQPGSITNGAQAYIQISEMGNISRPMEPAIPAIRGISDARFLKNRPPTMIATLDAIPPIENRHRSNATDHSKNSIDFVYQQHSGSWHKRSVYALPKQRLKKTINA